MDIYVSSLAFIGKTPEKIVEIAKENNFNLEFSSGMPYRADMEEFYLNATVERMLHNYFPAPEVPFVLNLASADKRIRTISIQHCKNGLLLSQKSGAAFFAAHAGFCIDPKPSELGQKIEYNAAFDKQDHWELFFDSLSQILVYAEQLGVDFLIENNVIAEFNLSGGRNPLLCCDSNEMQYLFEYVKSDRLGLLLDAAHLKVSAATLGLNLNIELDHLKKYIKN